MASSCAAGCVDRRKTSDVTSEPDDRLLAPYRPVRRVSAGEDVPWSGLLVRLASGEPRILVDAGQFEDDWAGWHAPPDGHVLAPLDVIRRSDGHDVMLPLCVERVEAFLARRAASRVPLSIGETVTLGVSLVRGIAASDDVVRATGEWWLTDAGRPVLATGASEREAAAHTSELLHVLAAGSACAEALAVAAEVVGRSRVSAYDLRDAEDGLFAVAAPEPLATTLLGPRAARDLVPFDRTSLAGLDDGEPGPGWVNTLARHVDADLADAVSRATTGLWRRLRTPRSGSRRPWLLATGAAAVVLAAGVMWPTDSGGPATAGTTVDEDAGRPGAAAQAPTPDPPDVIDEDGDAPTDLVSVTDRLLATRLSCAGDQSCLAGVIVDPASAFASGVIDLDPSHRQTTVLDEFGGVAVLRVDAVAGTPDAQLVVIMLQDDRWLLRDVHPAKQP